MLTLLQHRLEESGYFLTRDAVALGMDERSLRRMVAAGVLTRIRHGTYAHAGHWRQANLAERHLVLVRSVLERARGEQVVSHTSAVLLHTEGWWDLDLSSVHLTRELRGQRRETGVVHHRGVLPAEHVCEISGIPVVTAARAAVELTTVTDLERSLVVLDSLLRERTVSPAALAEMVENARSWPGSLATPLVVALADGASGSVGESRCRYRFHVGQLPAPILQHPVYDGSELVAVLDFWWPGAKLAGEFDGRVKYGRLLRPGDQPSDVVVREKIREDRVRELLGCRFVRYTWTDFDDTARFLARTRTALGSEALIRSGTDLVNPHARPDPGDPTRETGT